MDSNVILHSTTLKENKRYKNLQNSLFFIAGDIEQFVSHIRPCTTKSSSSSTDSLLSIPSIQKKKCDINSIFNTFEYISRKFKKGCLVQIVDKEVTFLPFSNQSYVNNWKDKIEIDPIFSTDSSSSSSNIGLTNDEIKYKDFLKMIEKMNEGTKYEKSRQKYNFHLNQWVCQNGLLRSEWPSYESLNGFDSLFDMFQTLVKERGEVIPEIVFFLNKRDFPILKSDNTEPYENIFDNVEDTRIEDEFVRTKDTFLPILSMTTTNEENLFLDIPVPTWDDWARVKYWEDESATFTVANNKTKTYPHPEAFLETNFENKKNTAVFRGASTGIGTTIETNKRLFLCHVASQEEKLYSKLNPKKAEKLLDCKITKWNCRPRKKKNDPYFRIIDKEQYSRYMTGEELSPLEQSKYKYIFHLEGHSAAYRLSLELYFGSVIIMVPSKYKLWYSSMLEEYKHYVPLHELTRESIINVLDWCENNQEKCKEIATNARAFAEKVLSKEGILDYLQELLIKLRKTIIDAPSIYQNKNSIQVMQSTYIETELEIQKAHLKKMKRFHSYLSEDLFFNNQSFQYYLASLDAKNELGNFLEQTFSRVFFRRVKHS